ncbi:MAG: ferrous iron transport protein A [Firmicutes bacterium]|nr:ferrous iron transport protein A [Bacillota bacterium]
MNNNLVPLSELPPGRLGIVKNLAVEGVARRRMFDLGLIHGTAVESLMKSPAGDPIAYRIRGAVIALRLEEAEKLLVEVR